MIDKAISQNFIILDSMYYHLHSLFIQTPLPSILHPRGMNLELL